MSVKSAVLGMLSSIFKMTVDFYPEMSACGKNHTGAGNTLC